MTSMIVFTKLNPDGRKRPSRDVSFTANSDFLRALIFNAIARYTFGAANRADSIFYSL
jgi:hypothetical protein